MADPRRLSSVMRGVSPCANCEERHTACWDSCPKYKAWKAEAQKVKEAKKAYAIEMEETYTEYNRRSKWRRRTF